MSFFKNREQDGLTDPVWVLVTVGQREEAEKECRRVNMVEILCIRV
jgi:hypothetical protein